MSSLAALKELSKRASGYIPFSKLKRDKYVIKSTSLMKSNFDNTQRLVLHIEKGYVILPARFIELSKKKSVMTDLNSGKSVMIYNGKDKKSKRIDLDFETIAKTKNKPAIVTRAADKKKKSVDNDKDEDNGDNNGDNIINEKNDVTMANQSGESTDDEADDDDDDDEELDE